ncbi:hypothetical protein BG60_18450 [Caballeronia zhejiangensis]|uniref:Lipoprotein n=1 Tax=Caballeronia zhejiangensis TaxID=871203 RepID=A0A656QBK6_9BURK|nr:hypothetical protein BYI23_F000720 [Burkholderia sp. YI23]KDR27181.1 hypothetical protein BG60_18450 [Caballeronia zhejiangensis]
MKMLAFLPVFILLCPTMKVAKKGWRLVAVLFVISLMSGCANSSNKFDKSPCACNFQPINTGSYGSKTNA